MTTPAAPPQIPPTEGIVSVTIYRNKRGQQIEELRRCTGDALADAVHPVQYAARAQGAVECGPPGREQHIPVPFTCYIPAADPLDAFAKLDACLQDQGKRACDEAKAEYDRQFRAHQLTQGLAPGGMPLRLPKGKGG